MPCRRFASPSCCLRSPGPGSPGSPAVYWHFVRTSHALTAAERATLDRLLTYGPRDASDDDAGELLLVLPRPGTISPWASKATDIAHNCGLPAVERIERGIAYRIGTRDGAPLAAADRAALLPLLHDRMTEAVFPALSRRGAPVRQSRAAAAGIDRADRPRTRGDRRSECSSGPRAVRRRNRLPGGEFPRTRGAIRPTSS